MLRKQSDWLQIQSSEKLAFRPVFLTFHVADTASSPIDSTLAKFNDWGRSRDQPPMKIAICCERTAFIAGTPALDC